MGKNSIIGIAWFDENDWDEWKKISEDEIEDKYDDWLVEASYPNLNLKIKASLLNKLILLQIILRFGVKRILKI